MSTFEFASISAFLLLIASSSIFCLTSFMTSVAGLITSFGFYIFSIKFLFLCKWKITPSFENMFIFVSIDRFWFSLRSNLPLSFSSRTLRLSASTTLFCTSTTLLSEEICLVKFMLEITDFSMSYIRSNTTEKVSCLPYLSFSRRCLIMKSTFLPCLW